MSSFLKTNVLITGAGSGLGQLLAVRSAQLGASRLFLWDVDEQGLRETARQLEPYPGTVHTHQIDLTDFDQVYESAASIIEDYGGIDILINNAGIVTGKRFEKNTRQEIQNVIELNVLAVMHITRAFLQAMIERDKGHIVNIASAAGLMGNPGMSVYAGSKWAVSGWSESLRLEMKDRHDKLHVTTVQPSYIDTGMFSGVKPPLLTPILKAETIADNIIEAVQRNKTIVRQPFMVKLIPFLKGVLPSPWFDFVAGKLFRVYHSMDTFRGRSSYE